MKKKIIIFILLVSVIILTCHILDPNLNFYSGKYTCQNSTNQTLVLKSNNLFVLHTTLGKTENSITGKYTISNNHINLLFNDKNLSAMAFNLSSGQVYGSVIIFSNPNNSSYIKFKKS
ncbi:hypothetical protein HBE96_24715 [Clostridium sp. P21]|uniref:Uncharacterized protein n=1 Tax=Clostridium muellerianum TaxID=2716538 RepID=A0A7Y0ELQ3_9CLOT|nr:hypothetical protein [Clostridium muellerianum]NMM65784.1 hypothetical protein [Clostridium muellerianum]